MSDRAAFAPSPKPASKLTSSVVSTDRLCRACGMNLVGCSIEVEPRYDLRIARCPNCEAVAAMEEYPPLTHWSGRWSALIAGLLTVFMLVVGIGGLAACSLMPVAITAESTDRQTREIFDIFQAWLQERHPDEVAQYTWTARWERFPEFWLSEGDATLANLSPVSQLIEWDEFTVQLVPICTAMLIGVIWSCFTLGRRSRGVILVSVALLALSLLVLAAVWTGLSLTVPASTEHVSWRYLRIPILASVYALVTTTFIAGVLLGRPVLRGVLRLMLPVRSLGSLALLWTGDGLPVPRPRLRGADR